MRTERVGLQLIDELFDGRYKHTISCCHHCHNEKIYEKKSHRDDFQCGKLVQSFYYGVAQITWILNIRYKIRLEFEIKHNQYLYCRLSSGER